MRRVDLNTRVVALIVAMLFVGATGYGQGKAKLEGYLEWRHQDIWIVDGQRIAIDSSTEFKGKGDAKSPESTPLGYEVKVAGVRRADGVLQANKVEARQNETAKFEREVLDASDQIEAAYRQAGQMFQLAPGGVLVRLGELHERGPRYERVRRIVDRLLPPYIPKARVRVYVVDNQEWNAMAMGNYSIYVFSGLMDHTDDDELALVLGHEIAHASHEHARRQQQKNKSMAARAVGFAPQETKLLFFELDAHERRAEARVAARLSTMILTSRYSRDLEDQADRVGMRYTYEGGYDVSKGPRLWERFGESYGEASSMQYFFLGSHSRWSDRAQNLHQQLGFNYRSSR